MIWTILSVIAVVFPVLVVVVLIQPDEFVVERSATLAAPAAAVFAKVNDFHKWTEWSPWEKLDPNLKRTYAGNESGVGAIYSWAGNGKAGEGRMAILESKPAESILLRLEFFKPFKATNSTEFTFRAEGSQTQVHWAMKGKNNFMSKAFHLLMNMDKIVGGDFENGLANLEKAAQSAS